MRRRLTKIGKPVLVEIELICEDELKPRAGGSHRWILEAAEDHGEVSCDEIFSEVVLRRAYAKKGRLKRFSDRPGKGKRGESQAKRVFYRIPLVLPPNEQHIVPDRPTLTPLSPLFYFFLFNLTP
jgi:hypothetical protein